MQRAIMGLVIGAALAAACSSFSSDPASPAPGGADAASEAATIDAPEADASNDASSDGGAFFCHEADAHDLCEDFDQGTLDMGMWQAGLQSVPDSGVAQLASVVAKSAPSSLLVSNSTVGASDQRSYFIHRNLAKTAATTVVLSFELFVDTLTNAGGPSADSLVAIIGDGTYINQIRVANVSGLLNVDVVESIPAQGANGYFADRYTFGGSTFATQRWHRFVLTSHRDTNELALTIDGIDGMRPAGRTTHVPSGRSANLGLDLGSQSDTHGETMKLYYDDVTVDLDR